MRGLVRTITACAVLSSALGLTSVSAAQSTSSCDPALLTPSAVTARDLAVSSPAFPASRCFGVNVGPLEISAPVAVADTTTCDVAVLHRRTILRSELCGNDVHFDPIVQVGVVILRRAETRWTRIASGMLDVEIAATGVIEARDTDADGRAELVLDRRLVLAIVGRRVRVLRAVTP